MKSYKCRIAIVACACALCFGLAACGGGGNASSSASASAPSAASSSASAAASAASSSASAASSSSSASASAASSSAAASASATSSDIESWGNAWMGVSDKNETLYYAESPDGTQGIMAVLDPSTGNYASFVGPVTRPSETQVQILDETTNMTLTFEVTAADSDGNVVIDMGEQGKAVLASCPMKDVVEALAIIDQYGKAVNPAPSSESSSAASEASAAASTSAAEAEMESWGNAWMGVSDKNETLYYAESPDGTQGVMAVLDPSTGNYASFVGSVTRPSETQVQIVDKASNTSLTFEVTAADSDGNVVIDMGEQGKAVLASCPMKDVVEALAIIDQYGKAVN